MNAHKVTYEVEIKQIDKGPFLGVRHLQATLLFLHITVLMLNRMHISLSIVAMMSNDVESSGDFPVYKWNEQQKSYIYSSFYPGYILTLFLGAYCSRRFGAKINLFIYTMVTGITSLLMPYCISWGDWYAFCVLRFIMGLSQGGFYPTVLQHLAKWSTPGERAAFSGLAHAGFDCGIVTAMLLTGVIATSSLGWPGTFYIYAAFCFVWCALWLFLGANDAATSNLITAKERLYIDDALKSSVSFETNRPPIPWRAIFSSKPFYALLVSRTVTLSGFVTLLTEWPSYVNSVLKYNLESNSLYSALPSVASWFSIYFFLFASNYVTKRSSLSLSVIRKCFNAVGIWIPAAGIVLIGFLDENYKILAIITMTLVMAFHSGCHMGSIPAPIDMAPNHAEIITSIVYTSSNIMVFLGPLFVGIVVNNEQDHTQWRVAFITIAVLICLGDLVYIILGSAKEQPWNSVDFVAVKKAKHLPETAASD